MSTTMSRGHTLLMVGHPQGSVDRARSDEAPRRLDLDRAALPDGGGLLRASVDTRGDRAAAARRARHRAGSARRSGAPTTSARPGRRPPTARSASPRTPAPSLARVWQLVPGSADGDDVVVRRHRAAARSSAPTDRGETFELVRGLWDHPHRPEWNAGLRRPGLPHDPARTPTEPDCGARRDLDRRRLRDRRRRRARGTRPTPA